MRLFIAIDFNGLKDYFSELQYLLPNTNLNLTKTFHLTLKFLGEVQPHISDKIIKSLKNIEFQSFEVHLDSIGVFPTEESIRVVWVGLQPEEKVLDLQRKIDESLKDLLSKEKDFKAHITLARVKYVDDNKSFLGQIKRIKVDSRKVEVKGFRLMKSTLTSEGPVYEDLVVFGSR